MRRSAMAAKGNAPKKFAHATHLKPAPRRVAPTSKREALAIAAEMLSAAAALALQVLEDQ